nr:MDIS1-interacting receptor like kinase 2-like [Tanacetum cinerariifolium]
MNPLKNAIFVQLSIVMLATVFISQLLAYASLTEVSALLNWKASLQDQNNNSILSSWTSFYPGNLNNTMPNRSPCNWYGISCNSGGSINRLNLSSSNLTGTLDTFSFSSFPNLTHFELSVNNFYGIIPPTVGNLSKLVFLDFNDNHFSSTIPPQVGLLENLEVAHFARNKLSGSIPHRICHMMSLYELVLSFNSLSGDIPVCLGNLTNLRLLRIDVNEMSGAIPNELGNLSELNRLVLPVNNLYGPIPNTLGNLSKLRALELYNNNIHGPIPPELGNLSSLETLYLDNNSLTGLIPNSLGQLKSLTDLYLFKNNLSGPIPEELGNMLSIVTLQLSINKLNGSIPKSFGKLLHLKSLFLSYNKLSGPLPHELGNLKLSQLDLSLNSISGSLPDTICNGGRLQALLVVGNKLKGKMPRDLYNCSSLFRMRIDGNQVEGNISEIFGVYPYLRFINLSDNRFYGELSDNWSKCPILDTIELGGNGISGSLPPSLGNSSQLGMINLSFNHLVGKIPKEFEKISSLKSLFLSGNQLSGVIPPELGSLKELTRMDLSLNNFGGPIPETLGNCVNLNYLNLANNELDHEIPVQLAQLSQLSSLDLSNNLLNSNIPSEIASMSSLEKLNLSHNQLSGNIPKSMEQMRGLSSIDISYNDLQGPIPNSNGFLNASFEALQGNPHLCGNITGLPQCKNYRRKSGDNKEKHLRNVLIATLLLGIFLFLSIFIGIFFFSRQEKEQSWTEQLEEDQNFDFFSILSFKEWEIYDDILEATREFDEAFCIGKGRFGSVYKADLPSNRIVAVKKLYSDSDMIDRSSFLNEVKALTTIKHRNIVSLYGYCSRGKNAFLVYEYLEGGDLYQLLKREVAQTLDWIKRVDIIKDIAHALSYMHHDCFPPIVHRDISSKNILLNSEYEAFISDFGTAKILNPNTANETAVAGTFGYMAPELSFSIKVTEKCDVYSFGVLAMELVKGEHPGDIITSPLYEKLGLKDLVDRRLPFPVPEIQNVLTSIIIVAIECLNANPEMRPTMYDVSQQISAICASQDSICENQFSFVRRSDLWRDVKRRVLTENSHTHVVGKDSQSSFGTECIDQMQCINADTHQHLVDQGWLTLAAFVAMSTGGNLLVFQSVLPYVGIQLYPLEKLQEELIYRQQKSIFISLLNDPTTGRMRMSVIMKCTSDIRQLAYGNTPDAFDEYLQMAGANNDINVLDNSSLFDDLLDDIAFVAPFVVNGVRFEKGFYLADGIYRQWVTFIKSFTIANDEKHSFFKRRQECARKDVERAFGVL